MNAPLLYVGAGLVALALVLVVVVEVAGRSATGTRVAAALTGLVGVCLLVTALGGGEVVADIGVAVLALAALVVFA